MFVADMHCDTLSAIYDRKKDGIYTELLKNDMQLDLEKMKISGYMLQNFAIFVYLENGENPYNCYKNQLKIFQSEMEKNKTYIRQIKSYEDFEKNQKEGVMSAMLTVEEGEVCEGRLERLEELYQDGVRMMTFTWNYKNSLGMPANPIFRTMDKIEAKDGGLTEQGIAFLEKMEQIGIIPDVSHLSEQGFYDVCKYGKRPFVASHSNALTLCKHKRNLSDDMIRKLADKGGVIGTNYYGSFLTEQMENGVYFSRVSRIADHILHMVQVGGIACVGLGSDFDGMDDNLEMADCSQLDLLYKELKSRGLKESEIEAVFYKNVCNLYKEWL